MSRGSTLNRAQRRNKGLPTENHQKLLAAVAGLGRILDLHATMADKLTGEDCARIAADTIELVGFNWKKRETKNVGPSEKT